MSLYRMVPCRHGEMEAVDKVEHDKHPEWAACVGYGLMPVDGPVYQVGPFGHGDDAKESIEWLIRRQWLVEVGEDSTP